MLPIKAPFTLRDYILKGFFGNDSSDDDNTPEDEAIQCCMALRADELVEVKVNPINTTQEVDQKPVRFDC